MKQLIHGGRAVGKTTEALKVAAQTGAYLVVHNTQAADDAFRLAKEMGLNIRYPITYDDLKAGELRRSHPNARKVVIDNADYLLRHFIGPLEIEAVTMDEIPVVARLSRPGVAALSANGEGGK